MTAADGQPALAGEGIGRSFAVKGAKRKVAALSDLSFTIAAGSLTAWVGTDGAGKTTLLRLAAGLLKPDAGTLKVLGIDVAADPQAVQDRISYMPQRFGLYDDLSVQENLDLYADLHGVSREERAKRYARLMEMTELGPFTDRLAGKLSGGMKQKLGLACTLVRSPELLLLDEPTVGVDPLSRRELWEIVEQLLRDEKITVVFSTAYLDEAERCSQVFLLREGQLLASGAPETVRRHAERLCFVATPPPAKPPRLLQARLLDDIEHVMDSVPQAGEVRFIRRRDANDPQSFASLAGAPVREVPARLEDGFMVMLRERQAQKAMVPSRATPNRDTPSANTNDTIIEVKDLVRKFGEFTAVENTSFKVRRGEVFGLLGPNGAGKTTTFRILCGLLPATSGTVRVAGTDLRRASASARRRIGYVAQKFALSDNLTVNENLRFFAGAYGLHGRNAGERIADVAGEFNLIELGGTPSGLLSRGNKQRLAMAAALLHKPEILFLDEATSGTDPVARREFWRRITALALGGTTVVITTHFMEEAEYCDRIVIQDAGKVLAIGSPQEVREAAGRGTDKPEGPLSMESAFIRIVEQARSSARQTAETMPSR